MRLWTGAAMMPVLLVAALVANRAQADVVPGVAGNSYAAPIDEPGLTPGPFVPPAVIDAKTSRIVLVNPEAPPVRPVRRLLNHFNMKCKTSFKEPSCQSCWQDLKFIFGSCKTFFGEPCLDRAQPTMLDVGVELPDGKGCTNCGRY